MGAIATVTIAARAQEHLGPFYNPANDHQYYLVFANSWFGAEIDARRLGGHLAVVEDAAENSWLQQTFRQYAQAAWIGAHDAQSEGTFRTTDGRRLPFSQFSAQTGLNSPDSDFVDIDLQNGDWRLQNALTARHGIVKISKLPTVIAGPVINAKTGSAYYLLSDSTWTQAQAKARELGGNLVTVSNLEENQWLLETFGAWDGLRDVWLWIGLTDAQSEGQFRWVSGQPLQFTRWSGGQPDNAGAREHYVQMYSSGAWNDLTDIPPPELNILWLGVVEIEPFALAARVSQIELSWPTSEQRRYQIERNTQASGPWVPFGQVMQGTGSLMQTNVSIPLGEANSNFRIKIVD